MNLEINMSRNVHRFDKKSYNELQTLSFYFK